jgi:predicted TIM-barrel fold metal-dependent hydrolase
LRVAGLGPPPHRERFGTDYPFIRFQPWPRAFRAYEPSPEIEAKGLKGNAERLLGLAR